MVGSDSSLATKSLERFVVVREYQGSSYGHVPFSGGEPEGHYRTVQFSTGVFSAQENRFNAYLRDNFSADVLARYHGISLAPLSESQEDLHSGYTASKRMSIDGKLVEIEYWSNAHRGGILPHNRMYSLTIRLEAMPENVGALEERMSTYFTQLQQTFGLESTNTSNKEQRAA